MVKVVGITWQIIFVGGGGVSKPPMGFGNLNLKKNQVKKEKKKKKTRLKVKREKVGGITWKKNCVGGGGVSKPTMGVRNLNLQKNQVRKRQKNGLNQSLIYRYLFPHSHPNYCYLPLSNSVASITLFSGIKKYGEALAPPPPPPDMPMTTVFEV